MKAKPYTIVHRGMRSRSEWAIHHIPPAPKGASMIVCSCGWSRLSTTAGWLEQIRAVDRHRRTSPLHRRLKARGKP